MKADKESGFTVSVEDNKPLVILTMTRRQLKNMVLELIEEMGIQEHCEGIVKVL